MSNKNRRNRNSDGESSRRPKMETVDNSAWKVMAKNVLHANCDDDDWDEINETVVRKYGKYSNRD